MNGTVVKPKHLRGTKILERYVFWGLLFLCFMFGFFRFSFFSIILFILCLVGSKLFVKHVFPKIPFLSSLYWKCIYLSNVAYVFETNNLVERENYSVTSLVGKEKVKKERVIFFPSAFLCINDEYILVEIRLDGSKYQKKYMDLDDNFSQLFVLPLSEKIVKNGRVTYIFKRQADRQYIINEGDEGFVFKETKGIPLNTGIIWDYTKCPHAIVAGQTGKGKTYFLFYLIRNILAIGGLVKIIDAKMSDLAFLDKYFGDDVVSSRGKIMKLLRETKDLMNERFDMMRVDERFKVGENYAYYGFKPIFLVFDEFVAFAGTLDSKEKKEMNGYLLELILKGRQAGVFVILATQRPDAEFLSGNIRDQLGLRVAFGGMSKDGYGMVFGNEFRDLMPRGQAEGYIYLDGENTVPNEFDAPYLNEGYDFIRDIERLIGYSTV